MLLFLAFFHEFEYLEMKLILINVVVREKILLPREVRRCSTDGLIRQTFE
jgi:hypothetical protein